MKLEVNEQGEIVLSEVYNGIGIKTEVGMYGIAQRDGGCEIMLNGVLIHSPTPPMLQAIHGAVGGGKAVFLDEWKVPVEQLRAAGGWDMLCSEWIELKGLGFLLSVESSERPGWVVANLHVAAANRPSHIFSRALSVVAGGLMSQPLPTNPTIPPVEITDETPGPFLNFTPPANDLREALAAYAHEAWAGWMRYLFARCTKLRTSAGTGSMAVIPEDLVSLARRRDHREHRDDLVGLLAVGRLLLLGKVGVGGEHLAGPQP